MWNIFKKEDKGIMGTTSIINAHNNRNQRQVINKSERLNVYRGWIYGTVNLISNNVAQTPLRLFTPSDDTENKVINFRTKTLNPFEIKGLQSKTISNSIRGAQQVEELPQHPAVQLLSTVNSYLDGFGLFHLTQTWLDLDGDAYWYVQKGEGGQPEQIHILDPQKVKILVNKEQDAVLGYVYKNMDDQTQAQTVTFTPDEIVHFSSTNPYSRFHGESPLRALATPVDKLALANRFETAILENNGMPLVLLKCDRELKPDEVRLIEEQFSKGNSKGRQGGVKVLDKTFDMDTISYSLADMMINEQQIFDLKAVAFAYGVPFSMLDSSDQKKAGLDEMIAQFNRNCLVPRLSKIEQALNQQYLPMWTNNTNEELVLSFDPVDKEDEEVDAKILVEYVKNGILSKNEARGFIGVEGDIEEENSNQGDVNEEDN
jgi:HK97 family phage portal protein